MARRRRRRRARRVGGCTTVRVKGHTVRMRRNRKGRFTGKCK